MVSILHHHLSIKLIAMETTTIDKDIKVFYITASSFPAGIEEAHNKIHALAPFSTGRKYFGISRPEKGNIVYKAGAEEIKEGEAEKFKLDTLILKKGRYVSETIHDFMKNVPAIGETFQKMLQRDDIDPQGYCVEWYFNEKDVKLMVRLKD
jgi:hypothetical protein